MRMKVLFLSGFLTAWILGTLPGFGQTFQWSKNEDHSTQLNVSTKDFKMGIYQNELYICGMYAPGKCIFASGADSLTGPGGVYLAKYNTDGKILWARHAVTSSLLLRPADMVIDSKGNLFVLGYFRTSVTIGTTTFAATSGSVLNMFLACYDTSGTPLWAKGFYSKSSIYDAMLSVNKDDQVIVAGTCSDSVTADALKIKGEGCIIAGANSAGDILWLNTISATPKYMSTDDANNIYLAGNFNSSITTSAGTLNTKGSNDIFLIKCNNTASILWQKQYGDVNGEYISTIKAHKNQLFFGGDFYSTAKIGTISLTSTYQDDLFISKLDTSGNVIWAHGVPSFSTWCGDVTKIYVDQLGNSYYTGNYYGEATFGTIKLEAGGPGYFTFLAKYNASGTVSYAVKPFGSYGMGVVLDNAGMVYVVSKKVTSSSQEYMNLCKYSNSNSSGLDDGEFNSGISIYPNPSAGILQVHTTAFTGSAEVYNLMGERVYSTRFDQDKFTIDLSSQPDGVYFIQLLTGEQVITKKIVVRR